MKICFVGGNAPRLVNLMNDMRDRGHEVHWIVLDVPKYVIPGITIHDKIRLRGRSAIEKLLLAPYYLFYFKNKIKQISPDIIHAINVEWSGWLSVFSGFKNVVVTAQGGDVMVRESMKKNLIHRWLRRYTLNKARVITYGNDTMLSDIKLWARPQRTLKYFAGVNLETMKFRDPMLSLREELNIGNRKVVFSPRTLDSNSNIDIVIRTIPIVKEIFADVVYIFSFTSINNKYSLKMNKLIGELDVAKNCLFLGRLGPNEMADYYSISDVVISILSSDGMPATILESMAMKIPLVLTNIFSYTGLIKEKYAFMVDVRNQEATANALILALSRDNETAKMREIGYNWVSHNAEFKHQNKSLEKVYKELIGY